MEGTTQDSETEILNRNIKNEHNKEQDKIITDTTSISNPTIDAETTSQDSGNQPPVIPKKKESFFTFKKAIILYAVLYVSRSLYNTVYKPKDPNKTYYENSLKLNSGFDITFYLKDKYRRTQRLIGDSKQLWYNYDESNQFRFNLTLSAEEFENREYLSVVPVVNYNNKFTNKQESLICESGLFEELEERKVEAEGSMKGVIEKHNKGEKSQHLRTNMFFHLVVDENERTTDEDPIINHMYFRRRDTQTSYQPFLDCSQYWVLRRDKKPVKYLNETSPTIQIIFDTYWWYRFTWVMNFYVAEQQTNSLLHDSSAFEEIKNILSDNSYAYLTLLFSVNILHSLFSFLSVKNKVSFWNNVKTSEGISKRQYYLDFIFQMIIVCYLIDNEASFILIALTIVETIVSTWIALRLIKFERRTDGKFPYYQIRQEPLSSNEEKTAQYDRTATRFMSMLLFPALGCYSCYSFYYRGNIGLYSFMLKTLVSFIYAIGFINMTPQIYINYKFKSVERMPWKSMIYQFLNTIVDDLFAFAVKMPTLQRMSVFRDDVVFVVYLYQYWIYRNNKHVLDDSKKEE